MKKRITHKRPVRKTRRTSHKRPVRKTRRTSHKRPVRKTRRTSHKRTRKKGTMQLGGMRKCITRCTSNPPDDESTEHISLSIDKKAEMTDKAIQYEQAKICKEKIEYFTRHDSDTPHPGMAALSDYKYSLLNNFWFETFDGRTTMGDHMWDTNRGKNENVRCKMDKFLKGELEKFIQEYNKAVYPRMMDEVKAVIDEVNHMESIKKNVEKNTDLLVEESRPQPHGWKGVVVHTRDCEIKITMRNGQDVDYDYDEKELFNFVCLDEEKNKIYPVLLSYDTHEKNLPFVFCICRNGKSELQKHGYAIPLIVGKQFSDIGKYEAFFTGNCLNSKEFDEFCDKAHKYLYAVSRRIVRGEQSMFIHEQQYVNGFMWYKSNMILHSKEYAEFRDAWDTIIRCKDAIEILGKVSTSTRQKIDEILFENSSSCGCIDNRPEFLSADFAITLE